MLNRLLNQGGEERAISFQSVWGSGGDLTAFSTQADTMIDHDSATTVNAVWACVTLIADTISTLPVDAYIKKDGVTYPYRPRPTWVSQPDFEISPSAFWQQTLISLLIDGNAFIRVFRDPNTGDVLNLMTLDPMKVEVKRTAVGQKRFNYEGEGRSLDSNEVLHITGSLLMPGQVRAASPVDKLKENLGLAMALENFAARFFGQGTQTSGVITYPGQLTKEQADNLGRSFDNAHKGYKRSHRTGILSGGAQFVKTAANPDEAQMLDSRRLAVEDIARAYRVPLNMIGLAEKGAQSYNSNEQNAIAFVTHTLRPWIVKLEDAFSALLPNKAYIDFNVSELLRGDFATRVAGYSTALQSGWMTINEVRKIEDLRPVTDGDQNRVPLANVNLGSASLTEQEAKISMAQKLINIGFKPEDVLSALALPPIPHTGIPSTQLQNPSLIDPANPMTYDIGTEALPAAVVAPTQTGA
jgi:HK97 family phage portal protein